MLYYLLEQYYKAFLNFNKALCVNSFDITTLYYRGKAYFELGHYNKAFIDLKKVLEQYNGSENLLEIQPYHVDTLILQEKIWFNLEEYKNAIIHLSEALKLQPKNSTILALRGAMKNAVIDNSEIIKFNNVIACMLCGEGHFLRGQFKCALKNFKKALKIQPNNTIALIFYGKIYITQGELENALYF
ncbi:21068_t:CDS:2 [Dentiscutata erythropus]|uniref:21068_t:CDS:1 n=1 Tax=Dentiscutata erythropus TaxID=1348616 RepID=A0A9N9GDV5_9GLOM|nr:21068_t:CDS:2 [Dentiscutata erythropus]